MIEEKKSKYTHNVKYIGYIKIPRYKLRNPLFEKTKNKVVVQELDRLIPDINKVTRLEDNVSFDKLIEEYIFLPTSDININNKLL